ncbi:MAG: YIP1 family protein [Candidatus Hydrogenedentota bacterium]
MSEKPVDTSEPNKPLAKSGLWHYAIRILRHPRTTMRRLIAEHPRSGVVVLPILAGVFTAPAGAMMAMSVVEGRQAMIWVGVLALSIVGYWMYVYMYGGAYRMIGGWLGAGGDNSASRLALAWTQVPYLIVWTITVPWQLFYRDEYFPKVELGSIEALQELAAIEHSTGYYAINAFTYIGCLAAYIWSLFLLAEALQCSAWKAFGVKMIAVLLHIPIFMAVAIPAVILAAAFAVMTTM